MPECQCGATVTKQYARVFSPDDVDGVRCCPNCERRRDGREVRDFRGASKRVESDDVEVDYTRGPETVTDGGQR